MKMFTNFNFNLATEKTFFPLVQEPTENHAVVVIDNKHFITLVSMSQLLHANSCNKVFNRLLTKGPHLV